jgi:hypothetical protein
VLSPLERSQKQKGSDFAPLIYLVRLLLLIVRWARPDGALHGVHYRGGAVYVFDASWPQLERDPLPL